MIEALTVNDERAAKVVRERAEAGTPAAETVTKAVEIGARIIDSESTATNVDYVQRVFEERVGKLGQSLGETLDEGSAEIAEHIAGKFDAERADSVQGEIKTLLVTAVQHPAEAAASMLTAEDGSNPLVAASCGPTNKMLEAEDRHRKRQLERASREPREGVAGAAGRVADLTERFRQHLERDAGEEAVAEAEQAGTRKGSASRSASTRRSSGSPTRRGDCATHTGAEGAEGGGKKGDTLVEIGAAVGPSLGRDRLRVKDKKLSKNQAWTELNEAMAARAASFAVLVVAGEDRDPGRPRAAARVRGQQADRRRRPRGAGLARARGRLPARRRPRLDGPRPRPHGRRLRGAGGHRGGALLPEAGAGDQVGADRHQDLLGQGPRPGWRRWSRRCELKLSGIDGLWSQRPTRHSWTPRTGRRPAGSSSS